MCVFHGKDIKQIIKKRFGVDYHLNSIYKLLHIEKEVNPDVHVFMILGSSGVPYVKESKSTQNVTIIPLPPYSPQLNPIEKLWQYLRQHHWSNSIYEGYDHLRQAANEAWQKVCLYPVKIKSICRAKYIENAVF